MTWEVLEQNFGQGVVIGQGHNQCETSKDITMQMNITTL